MCDRHMTEYYYHNYGVTAGPLTVEEGTGLGQEGNYSVEVVGAAKAW